MIVNSRVGGSRGTRWIPGLRGCNRHSRKRNVSRCAGEMRIVENPNSRGEVCQGNRFFRR